MATRLLGQIFIQLRGWGLTIEKQDMGVNEYIKETQSELKRVSWPTRKQVGVSTFAIIVVSIGMSLLLGVYDFIFSSTLGKILVGNEGSSLVAPTSTLPTMGSTDTTAPLPGAVQVPIGGPTDQNAIIPGLPKSSGL